MTLQPGWFNRQMESVRVEVAAWPAWMRRAAGLEDDRMTWTTTPTEEGWYWMLNASGHPTIVKLYALAGRLHVNWLRKAATVDEMPGTRWFGPLTPPEDRP